MIDAPTYVSLVNSNKLVIFPKDCKADFGDRVVIINVADPEPKGYTYAMKISVYNLVPIFNF
jgi:hypothetical protein